MEKIYGMHKLVGIQLFWSRTPTFSSGTPTFCQMGVLNSCFQNPDDFLNLKHDYNFTQVVSEPTRQDTATSLPLTNLPPIYSGTKFDPFGAAS